MLFSKETPAAGGTAFAQFDAAWCYDGNGYIYNDTGTSLDVRIGASGSVQTLASGATLPIKLTWSMAELYVRRTDQSTTQVTVEATVGTGSGSSTEIAATVAAIAAPASHPNDPAAHRNIVRRTTTGNVTLTTADYEHQRFVLDADRDITLPAESTAQWRFLLVNTGAAYTATVKRAGGTLVGSIIVGGSMLVAWDGVGFGAA